MEVHPSLASDSLFENHGSRRAQSILDRGRRDASSPAGASVPGIRPSWTNTSPVFAKWKSGSTAGMRGPGAAESNAQGGPVPLSE